MGFRFQVSGGPAAGAAAGTEPGLLPELDTLHDSAAAVQDSQAAEGQEQD